MIRFNENCFIILIKIRDQLSLNKLQQWATQRWIIGLLHPLQIGIKYQFGLPTFFQSLFHLALFIERPQMCEIFIFQNLLLLQFVLLFFYYLLFILLFLLLLYAHKICLWEFSDAESASINGCFWFPYFHGSCHLSLVLKQVTDWSSTNH